MDKCHFFLQTIGSLVGLFTSWFRHGLLNLSLVHNHFIHQNVFSRRNESALQLEVDEVSKDVLLIDFWIANINFILVTLCFSRENLWGPWEPGWELVELDQGQHQQTDVHRTHWEICTFQEPSGNTTYNTEGNASVYTGYTSNIKSVRSDQIC